MNKIEPYTFIFDLDNTLVNTDNIKLNYNLPVYNNLFINPYNNIKTDRYLQNLLGKIKNKKIIFSNAMSCHVENVISALGIQKYFCNIIDRNKTKTLKPNLNSYIVTMQENNINDINKCIFFDDLIPNLITAKYIGWITVHISSKKIEHCCIDYSFINIHDALSYFINKNTTKL